MKPFQYVLWSTVICVSQHQSGPVSTDELVINININDKENEAAGLKHEAKRHGNGIDYQVDSDDDGEGEVDTYSGYKVLGITPHNKEQLNKIAELQSNQSMSLVVDWWSNSAQAGKPVMAAVTPDQVQPIMAMLLALGLTVNVTIQDLQEVIEEESKYRNDMLRKKEGWNLGIYHNLEEIQSRVKNLVAEQPTVLSIEVLGKTHEGRNIEVVKVEQKGDNRPVIWIDCGIHAREWITQATCLHILDKLIMDKTITDKKVNMLATFDFYILPVTNPDGYAFSWASNRMWRKNRRPINGSWRQEAMKGFRVSGGGSGDATAKFGRTLCTHGVDLNRNFPVNFGGEGASDDPCSNVYHGPAAFSEAESLAIKTGIEGLQQKYGKERVAAYVSIHSFSQFWLAPFAYTKEKPKDYQIHMDVMGKAVTALKAVYGTEYIYGPSSEVIYVSSGSSKDWTYKTMGIKYSFSLELRDQGAKGFILPQDQIVPTATETWESIKAMSLHIAKELGSRSGSGSGIN